MIDDVLGVLSSEGDRRAVCFERSLGAPRAAVWRALTDPVPLARWFARVEGDLVVGGVVTIVFDDGDDPSQRATGVVLECVEETHLHVSWGVEDEATTSVTVDLDEAVDGTLLRLVHRHLTVDQAAGYSAGWHAHLDRLATEVAGGGGKAPAWDERFSELLPRYRAALG